MSVSSAVEIRVLRQIGALDAYREAWSDLLAQTPQANYFQSLEWLEVYARHSGAVHDWRVLVVRENGRVAGFLPLVIRTDRTPIGGLRTLTYPLDDWGTFYGPIGPEPAEVLAIGLRHLREHPRDWDVLDLRWVGRDEFDRARTRQTMREAGFSPRERLLNQVAIVKVDGTWSEYLASRSGKWRENFRHAERKAAEAGQIAYLHCRPLGERHGEADPRWDLYAICERLAAQSWQGSVTRGTTLSHDAVRPFLRDAHAAAARAGCADMHILSVEGSPAAFLYNYVYAGNVYGLRAGFDPKYSSLEVGKVLLAKALESSFELGDRTYDLGPDQIEYKRHWATQIVGSYSYCDYPATDYRAQAMRWQRQMRAWLRPPHER